MILAGTLTAVPDTAADARPWRAQAARDADAAATTQAQYVDATRHAAVRDSIAILRGAHSFTHYPPAARQADVVRLLAAAVEKQARISGLGRVVIPVGGVDLDTPERDRAAEVEAAEDRADQAAYDAARERA